MSGDTDISSDLSWFGKTKQPHPKTTQKQCCPLETDQVQPSEVISGRHHNRF